MSHNNLPNLILFEGNPKVGFGGGQQVSLNVVKALKDDWNIHLVHFGQKGQSTQTFVNEITPYLSSCNFLWMPHSKNTSSTGSNISLKELLLSPLAYFLAFIKVLKLIKTHSKDKTLVYSAIKKGDLLAYFLKKLTGIKTLSHLHTVENHKGAFVYGILKTIYEAKDLTFSVSEYVKGSWDLSRTKVLPNPAPNWNKSEKVHSSSHYKIGIIGHLIESKGTRIFLNDHAELLLQADSPSFEVHCYGQGPQLEELSKSYPKVHFHGFISDIEKAFENIDIIVLPTSTPESFGMVLLEAAAKGIPGITTVVGGQEEVASKLWDAKTCYDYSRPSSFKESLDFVLENYETLSLKGRKETEEQFSISSFNETVKKEFNRVFDKGDKTHS
ncbi:MAG: glycosyltransferase family 4 protein [Bacteriovoracaceae bacterium]